MDDDEQPHDNFKDFQRVYLTPYLLALTGDWLQGPFIYALYKSYGLSKADIEILFVAGFLSSSLFGIIVGSVADQFGRRNNCIFYGFLYALSCLTIHFGDFRILLIGRVLAGVSSSILHSAFESWVVTEHCKRGFKKESLDTIFSHVSVGTCLVAIASGVVSQHAVNNISLVAPFDIALFVFILMIGFLVSTWTENYGHVPQSYFANLRTSFHFILSDERVLSLGIVQSLFESAMYCFILEWSPCLTDEVSSSIHTKDTWNRTEFPYGYIFTSFMMAMMIGSGIFKIISRSYSPENFMRAVLAVSAACLVVPIFFYEDKKITFAAFNIFEMCIGTVLPAFAVMRSKYIANGTRATTMNYFRIPVNLTVAVVLSQNLSIKTVFSACVAFLLTSVAVQHRFYKMVRFART